MVDPRRGILGAALVAAALLGPAAAAPALNTPNDFCTGDPCTIASDLAADANLVLDFGSRTVVLQKQLTMLPQAGGTLGSLTIRCGTFRIVGDGVIKGTAVGGPGGTVVIEAVNAIQLTGTTGLGDVRLTGADAGSLTLRTAVGSITGSGRINLSADGLLASGGTLTLHAADDVALSSQISMPGGTQGGGGTIDAFAADDLDLTGVIDVTGGQGGGGFVDAVSGGDMRVANLDLSGSSEFGDAGIAAFDAGGSVTIQSLFARGANDGENCGDGGDIDVFAGADATLVGPIDIRGRGLDCSGGFLLVEADRALISGELLMSGTGIEGEGGDLDVTARTLIDLTASGVVQLDGGDSGGGDLAFTSLGNINVAGTINAIGRSPISPGATLVDLTAAGTLTVTGTIDASGGAAIPDSGGDISLSGCKVDVAASAVTRALGAGGAILLRANDRLSVHGSFASGGVTRLEYGQRANPPLLGGAVFSPAATLVLDLLLPPCRICETSAECGDGNDCTVDTCDNFVACSHVARSGACTDFDACTSGEFCTAGVCGGGGTVACNDGNLCTTDVCFPSLGCIGFPTAGSCDDGDTCTTNDACSNGACRGSSLNCSDANPCTDDICAAGACSHPSNSAPCNDGNTCTTGEACSGGVCGGGGPADCDDGEVCTFDGCSPFGAGCVHAIDATCSDVDDDQKRDDQDECVTLAWSRPPTTPPDQFPRTFGLTATRVLSPPGSQGLLLKGRFNPAANAPTINPALHGLHVFAADAAGTLIDVSLPGGAGCVAGDGWISSGGGLAQIWKYRNRSGALPPACTPGSARGIASVQIKDGRLGSKQALQFKVKAKNASLLRPPVQPLTRILVSIALAAQPAPGVASPQARAGQCAEALFTGNPIAASGGKPFCKPKLRNGALDGATCKGL